jgi:HlyD family secretion protein
LAILARRRRAVWPWGLAAAAIAGVTYWGWFRADGAAAPPRFRAAVLDRGSIQESVTATGTAFAVETVTVGALVSGRIAALGADDNDEVEAGQVIARVDSEPFDAQVAQAKAAVSAADAAYTRARAESTRARREQDRVRDLAERGVVGAAERDAAEDATALARASEMAAAAEQQRARAALREAEIALERTTIVSPIRGIVLAREVEVGQVVAAAFQAPTLFTIARDLREMEVRAAIDEADVGKVSAGQNAEFTVDAHRGVEFPGTVARVRRSPTVTQGVVTYQAIIRFDNPERKVWPGMTATTRIITADKDNVVRVPAAALRFKPPPSLASATRAGEGAGERSDDGDADAAARVGDRRVYVLDADGTLRRVPIRIGVADEEHAELLEGEVTAGSRVVVGLESERERDGVDEARESGERNGPSRRRRARY